MVYFTSLDHLTQWIIDIIFTSIVNAQPCTRSMSLRVLDCFPIHHKPSGKFYTGSPSAKCMKEPLPPLWGPGSLFDTWHPVQRASPPLKSKHTQSHNRSVRSQRSTTRPSPHRYIYFPFPALFKSQMRVSVQEVRALNSSHSLNIWTTGNLLFVKWNYFLSELRIK